jgi:hypothetical protein
MAFYSDLMEFYSDLMAFDLTDPYPQVPPHTSSQLPGKAKKEPSPVNP